MQNPFDKKKANIIVLIPYVWGVRNILHSGLYDLLLTKYNVFLAIPPIGVSDIINMGIPKDHIISIVIPKTSRLIRFLFLALKKAHRQEKFTNSDFIFSKWYKKDSIEKLSIGKILVYILSFLFSWKSFFSFGEKLLHKLYVNQLQKEKKVEIIKINPIAVLSTNFVSNWEWPILFFLQDLGITTATHILSFDNLTSRGYLPLRGFTQYYSWQNNMSNELIKFHQINPKNIIITGTPQFDFHVSTSFVWDKHKTAQILKLDPKKPYIVYCSNHYKHTPGEAKLILFLIKKLREIDRFSDIQWVIRLHPLDRFSRWENIFKTETGIRISHPWMRDDSNSFWAIPSKDEIALLGNTLRYAQVVINMASTITLDSCVVDTPVICVGFHPDKGSEEDKYYHDVHFSHHYEPIISSGAVSFSTNIQEFINAVIASFDFPDEKQAQRKKLVESICGVVDGCSAKRIEESFSELLKRQFSTLN